MFVDEDVHAIDRLETQILKEIAFAKVEEARQKNEKANKKLSLAKRREQEEIKVDEYLELWDPPSLDGGDGPLSKDSDYEEKVQGCIPVEKKEKG